MKELQAIRDLSEGAVAELVLAMHISADASAYRDFWMSWLDRNKESSRRRKPIKLPKGHTGFDLENVRFAIEVKKPVKVTMLYARNRLREACSRIRKTCSTRY